MQHVGQEEDERRLAKGDEEGRESSKQKGESISHLDGWTKTARGRGVAGRELDMPDVKCVFTLK